MKIFKTKISSSGDDIEYEFECYDNTEPIEYGDYFIYFFCGSWDVQRCDDKRMKFEINKNEYKSDCSIDFISGFWENCYKIKSTNLELY